MWRCLTAAADVVGLERCAHALAVVSKRLVAVRRGEGVWSYAFRTAAESMAVTPLRLTNAVGMPWR